MAKYFTKPPLGTPLNPAHPLNRGLVGYWPFSEGAGSKTQDLSGKGNHGTLTNIVQSATSGWSGGKFGGAINFDGTDDYVDIGANHIFDIASTISISVWIKPNNVGHNGVIFSKWTSGATTANSYVIYIGQDVGNNKVTYSLYQSDDAVKNALGTTQMSANREYHLVLVGDGANITGYINGKIDGTIGYNGTIKKSTKKVVIGRLREEDTLYQFNGSLSEVRIYDRALSAQEVQQLYTDPFCMYEQKGLSRWAQLIKKGSFFFR